MRLFFRNQVHVSFVHCRNFLRVVWKSFWADPAQVHKKSGDILLTAKAWNGRLICAWLADTLTVASAGVDPNYDSGRFVLAKVLMMLSGITRDLFFFPDLFKCNCSFKKGKKGNQSSSCNTGRSLFLRPTLICVDDKYHQHLRPHSQWAPFPWTAVPLPDLMLSTKDIHGQILPHDGVEPQELESRLILVERIIANTCGYLMCPC